MIDHICTPETVACRHADSAIYCSGNKVRDGTLARAPDEMIKYASQWKVGLDELEAKTAEMTNAAGTPICYPV